MVCPHRSQVLSLDEPVKDSRGYVYEKANVLEYLRGHGAGARHPVAGELWVVGFVWCCVAGAAGSGRHGNRCCSKARGGVVSCRGTARVHGLILWACVRPWPCFLPCTVRPERGSTALPFASIRCFATTAYITWLSWSARTHTNPSQTYPHRRARHSPTGGARAR